MGKPRRELNDEEIAKALALTANKATDSSIAGALGISLNTWKRIKLELQNKGIMEPTKKQSNYVKPPDDGKDDPDADKEPEDPIIKPTRDMFITKAKQVLSDDMVKRLKGHLDAAEVLLNAETLYRKNIEAIGMNWDDFVQTALESYYMDTMEWYDKESQKPDFDKIMIMATEEATMKEFLERM